MRPDLHTPLVVKPAGTNDTGVPEAVAAWLRANANHSEFAASLNKQLHTRRWLSPRQIEVVENILAREAAPKPKIDDSALRDCFAKAKASGLRRPKLRLSDVMVFEAGPTSKNPGSLYVTTAEASYNHRTYLGRIGGGEFFRARACSDEQQEQLLSLLSDPQAALDAYGLRTGNCGCCDRPLTNEKSIGRGIGPVCAKRWGFAFTAPATP